MTQFSILNCLFLALYLNSTAFPQFSRAGLMDLSNADCLSACWFTAPYLIYFWAIFSSTSWSIRCSRFTHGIRSRLPHQCSRWIGRNALSISLLSLYNSQSTRVSQSGQLSTEGSSSGTAVMVGHVRPFGARSSLTSALMKSMLSSSMSRFSSVHVRSFGLNGSL